MARFVLLFLLFPTALSLAQAHRPAQFIDNGKEFIGRIHVPKRMPAERVVVLASGRVDASGRIRGMSVLRSKEDTVSKFQESVKSASTFLRLSPAIVDSEAREVWFSFSVVFEAVADTVEFSVYPSLSVNEEKPNAEFSSPQRVLDEYFPSACRAEGVIWTSTLISDKGLPSNPEISGGGARCQQYLEEHLLNSEYLPAMLEGVFVEASYLEIWY